MIKHKTVKYEFSSEKKLIAEKYKQERNGKKCYTRYVLLVEQDK
jgi:hypothetical protein